MRRTNLLWGRTWLWHPLAKIWDWDVAIFGIVTIEREPILVYLQDMVFLCITNMDAWPNGKNHMQLEPSWTKFTAQVQIKQWPARLLTVEGGRGSQVKNQLFPGMLRSHLNLAAQVSFKTSMFGTWLQTLLTPVLQCYLLCWVCRRHHNHQAFPLFHHHPQPKK